MRIKKPNINTNHPLFWPALFLAIGILIAGASVGYGVYRSRAMRTVTVKGLAETEVVADFAIWNISMNKVGGDLTVVQKQVDMDLEKMRTFLQNRGFNESEIKTQRIKVRDKFTGYSEMQIREMQKASMNKENSDRYVIETGLTVRSLNVDLIDRVSRELGELVKQGITIAEDYFGPIFIFNGLNDIKVSMIESATKNARASAEQFARDADAKLGDIQTANQGVFTIEARDSSDPWGNNEKQSINKKVRVVSTITYYLK